MSSKCSTNCSANVTPVDITDYINMPQQEAAKRLNISTSKLSKIWKKTYPKRRWPYRIICRVDREVSTINF
jgi:mRNA-degrading endonuclease RelE of RelBE toxin-antitoxin system